MSPNQKPVRRRKKGKKGPAEGVNVEVTEGTAAGCTPKVAARPKTNLPKAPATAPTVMELKAKSAPPRVGPTGRLPMIIQLRKLAILCFGTRQWWWPAAETKAVKALRDSQD